APAQVARGPTRGGARAGGRPRPAVARAVQRRRRGPLVHFSQAGASRLGRGAAARRRVGLRPGQAAVRSGQGGGRQRRSGARPRRTCSRRRGDLQRTQPAWVSGSGVDGIALARTGGTPRLSRGGIPAEPDDGSSRAEVLVAVKPGTDLTQYRGRIGWLVVLGTPGAAYFAAGADDVVVPGEPELLFRRLRAVLERLDLVS